MLGSFPNKLKLAPSISVSVDTPETCCTLCYPELHPFEGNMPKKKKKKLSLFSWFCFGKISGGFIYLFIFLTFCQHLSYNSHNSGQADKRGKPYKSTNLEQERKLPNKEFSFS